MTVLAPPPKFERGTSPQRHPWFLLAEGSSPPNLPPDCKITGANGGDRPPDEDQCPGCRLEKKGICGCNYDWENWEWAGERPASR